MILIDSSNTHNIMSVLFAHKIGLLLIPIKSCSVWLLNNQPSFITHRVLKVHVNMQGVNTEADFEVWDGTRYEVILGMAWLKEVNVWIACREGEVHEKLQNGKFFSIRGKIFLPNTLTLSHPQIKRYGKKGHQVFLIHISEVKLRMML